MITILVVDDHAIARAGLVSLLETEADLDVIGQAENGSTAIDIVRKSHPQVIIVDLMMPGMDGVELTKRIREIDPDAHILILTTFGDSDDIAHALESGARGALMKNTAVPDLLAAIRTVAAGGESIALEIRKMLRLSPPVPQLTYRQMEILQSVTRGLTNTDIAHQLGITVDCVKDHVNVILQKLGAANRSEAVAIALRKHLLKI